jgi:hypothetical protein
MRYLVCGLAWLVLLLSALPRVAYDGPVDNQLFVTGHNRGARGRAPSQGREVEYFEIEGAIWMAFWR